MATYIFSDIHGRRDVWETILAFISKEDKLICLGDVNDRVNHSYGLVQDIYNHPQVELYLRGNHEDMLVKAMKEWLVNDHLRGEANENLCYNGGRNTFSEWKNGKERNNWYFKLSRLPYYAEKINCHGDKFLLTHAGFSPTKDSYTEEEFSLEEKNKLIWGREHLLDKEWQAGKNTYCVFGHTPVQVLYHEEGIKFFADNHKILLDLGTYYSGRIALFNIDTFEVTYLKGE